MTFPNSHLAKFRIVGAFVALTIFIQLGIPFFSQKAEATQLLNTLVRFDRLAQAQPTTGTVCAKTSAVNGTETTVKVTFPTGFTLGAFGTFTVNTTNTGWPATAAAWPGILTATNVTSQDVTFPSSDLTVSTLYCFNWINTAAVTTGTAGIYTGSITTQATGPVTVDSGNYGVTTVSANADQLVVSATIIPTFSLALNNTADNLGALVKTGVSTSGTPRTLTINTNAPIGWYIWGRDTNQGLTSASAGGYTIPSVTTCSSGASSNSTLSTGVEGYNLSAAATSQTAGTGTVTIATTFVGGSLGRGGGLCNAALSYQTIASSNGTADTSVITLKNNAEISGITRPGADYTDTETFVGAGLF